jgi:hypothetical protein
MIPMHSSAKDGASTEDLERKRVAYAEQTVTTVAVNRSKDGDGAVTPDRAHAQIACHWEVTMREQELRRQLYRGC